MSPDPVEAVLASTLAHLSVPLFLGSRDSKQYTDFWIFDWSRDQCSIVQVLSPVRFLKADVEHCSPNGFGCVPIRKSIFPSCSVGKESAL